jgi:hypothetical protein
MGSRVHYILEKELVGQYGAYKEVRQPIFECDAEQIKTGDAMITAGKNFLELMHQRGAVLLDTEMVLGSLGLGYFGQPDKVWLILDKQGNVGIIITDWKTNKKKNMETNEYTKPMKEPFKYLPNNALGHYNTQLPLYGKLIVKMLEGTKYEGIGFYGCVIVHLTDEQDFTEYRVDKKVVDTIMKMDIKEYLTKLIK